MRQDADLAARATAFAKTPEGRRVEAILRGVAEELAPRLKGIDLRLDALEAHIKQHPPFEYCGIWREGLYEKNTGVTFEGSFWIATTSTSERPGDGATAWRMAVRRPRDGKDAPKRGGER